MSNKSLIGAVDQGTSSTRFLVFSAQTLELVAYHQVEIQQITPKPGWVEEDPLHILATVHQCIDKTIEKLRGLGFEAGDVKCIGITNQRESTIAWDRKTGKPLHNAIIWLDMRTAETVDEVLKRVKTKDEFREICGLPVSTYFSAVKMRWLLDNCMDVKEALDEERLCVGTVDSWLLWNLTGGVNGGKYCTDVTNASRTMLMNLKTLDWDQKMCDFFRIPKTSLPEIKSSSEIYGNVKNGSLKGVPISGILGDQQAALVGQRCLQVGQAKNTYGTGCFLLYNTGEQAIQSKQGLLTTLAYKFGNENPVYALEGAIAVAGKAVQWLRDNLGIIKTADDLEPLAKGVESAQGCYFVPAFSGLFCPHWESDARGLICGLTHDTDKRHIARATLEAVSYQTRDVLEAMKRDSGLSVTALKVDGGMTKNELLMQLQSDLTGVPVERPFMTESTALGAAMAAGFAQRIELLNPKDFGSSAKCDRFEPRMGEKERDQAYEDWLRAVDRSKHWVR